MKIISGRYDLVFYLFFPCFLLTTLLYWFFLNQLTQLALPNAILSAFLLVFVFFSKANTVLGRDQPSKIKLKWLISLFLSQLLVNTMLWSSTKIISFDVATQSYLFNFNLIELSTHNGLFPWGFAIFLALTLGYFTYHEEQLGLVSSACAPFFHNTYNDAIGVGINSYIRGVSLFTIILTLSLLSISMILLFDSLFHFSLITGINFQIIFVSTGLMLLATHPIFIKFIHQLMYRNIPTAIILVGFAVLISLLYPLLSMASNLLVKWNPLLDVFSRSQSGHLENHYAILIEFWWLTLSTMNGAFIAYVSKNKTMRQVIIGSCLTFLLTLAMIKGLDFLQARLIAANRLPLVLMILCCTVSSFIILNRRYLTYFLRATLPTNEPLKTRSTFLLLKITPLTSLCFLAIFFGPGTTTWCYLTLFICLVPIVILFICFMAFIKQLLLDLDPTTDCHPR